MKIYLGAKEWGWGMYGIGYGAKWFFGFSMRRKNQTQNTKISPDGDQL